MGAVKVLSAALATIVGLGMLAAAVIELHDMPRYDPVHVSARVEVTPRRVAQGKRLAGMLCMHCHLNAETGQLTGRPMPDLPSVFGIIYARNITQDRTYGIGAWTDGELMVLLRTGLKPDGTYVPPYMAKVPLMADEDLASIIAFLRSDDPAVAAASVSSGVSQPSFFTKVLTHTVMKPLPMPTTPILAPDPNDRLALGAYLVKAVTPCFDCHSADLAKNNPLEPEKSAGFLAGGGTLVDANGHTIVAPNLTPDPETGLGRWSLSQFTTLLRDGVKPTGAVVRYPMLRYIELTDPEVQAIFTYLKSLPPVRHRTPAPYDYGQLATSSPGERTYNQFGCVACHGVTGVGLYDLTRADAKYTSDSALEAWIRDPGKFVASTRMPRWEGIIPDQDFAPLVQHVRALGRRAHSDAAARRLR